MVKLGSRQKSCLVALVRHGGWPGGWVWGTKSETERVLNVLVTQGLATRRHVTPRFGYPFDCYAPTQDGVELVKKPGG